MIAISSSQEDKRNFDIPLGLVITRSRGESLAVVNRDSGDSIVLTLGDRKGNKARIGINAGDNYEIVRAELTHGVPGLYEAIREGKPITKEMLKGYDVMREMGR